MDVSIHLFPTLSDAKRYLVDHPLGQTYMCAEDYFEDEAKGDVETCYDLLKAQAPLCVSFMAQNNQALDTVTVEARYPGSKGPIDMKTADPFSECPHGPKREF